MEIQVPDQQPEDNMNLEELDESEEITQLEQVKYHEAEQEVIWEPQPVAVAEPIFTYRKLKDEAKAPIKGSEAAAGYDLFTTETSVIGPSETIMISTGLAFNIDKKYYGQIKIRSSLAKAGIMVLGGTIDPDYQGETMIIMHNLNRTQPTTLFKGDRVAQIVFQPMWSGPKELEQDQNEPIPTERGQGGFGSTGIGALATIVKHEITNMEHKKTNESTYKFGPKLNY